MSKLCEELNLNGERNELLALLEDVNNAIATKQSYDYLTPEYHKKKQAACIESSLTKFVKFTPKTNKN